jgi:hypothetical protein
MGILYEDKELATEKQKWFKEDGIKSEINRRKYGGKWYYEVSVLGQKGVSDDARKLVEKGIKPEHFIGYDLSEIPSEEKNFALAIKPSSHVAGKRIPPHIRISHELAHQKLGHEENEYMTELDRIKREEDAWRKTAEQLKKNGEWEDAKEYAVAALSTYYEGEKHESREEQDPVSIESLERAKEFIFKL